MTDQTPGISTSGGPESTDQAAPEQAAPGQALGQALGQVPQQVPQQVPGPPVDQTPPRVSGQPLPAQPQDAPPARSSTPTQTAGPQLPWQLSGEPAQVHQHPDGADFALQPALLPSQPQVRTQPQAFGQAGYPGGGHAQDPYQQAAGPGAYQMPPLPNAPWQSAPLAQPFPHGQAGQAGQAGFPRQVKSMPTGLVLGVVGGVTALGLVVTAAVLLSQGGSRGHGGSSSTGGSAAALTTGWSVTGSGGTEQLLGSWITDRYLVRVTDTGGAKAYDLTSGSLAWTVQPPAGASVPCTMSPTLSSSGIGTIGFGADAESCTVLVAVDTATGRELWTSPLTNKDHSSPGMETTFIDGDVVDLVGDNVLGGVNLTTGAPVWGYKPRGRYCNVYSYGGAGVVLVDDYCADVSPAYVVTALDGATGRQLWQKPGSGHVEFGTVLAGSPVVAQVDTTSGDTVTQRYDRSGNPTQLTAGTPISSRSAGRTTPVARMLNSTTMLVATQNSAYTPGIEAVDLTDGAVLWSYAGANRTGAELAFSVEDATGRIYALSNPADTAGGATGSVVSLDPATGAPTTLASLPDAASGTQFLAGVTLVQPGGDSAHPKVYFVGYGSYAPGVQQYR